MYERVVDIYRCNKCHEVASLDIAPGEHLYEKPIEFPHDGCPQGDGLWERLEAYDWGHCLEDNVESARANDRIRLYRSCLAATWQALRAIARTSDDEEIVDCALVALMRSRAELYPEAHQLLSKKEVDFLLARWEARKVDNKDDPGV